MQFDANILRQFDNCFECNPYAEGLPYDYVAYTKKHRDKFYLIARNVEPSNNDLLAIKKQIIDAIRNNQMESKPVVMFVQEGENLKFGIIIYWDDKKPYLNTKINWQKWEDANEPWFEMHIHARRMQIAYLPIEYLRVMKFIDLNANEVLEGQIVYLRKFTPTYKMKTPPVQTEEERFNRLLTGTPEKEYPADELDDYIFDAVRKEYPMATSKSKLLLFHTDLLNVRLYKDKLCKKLDWKIVKVAQVEQELRICLECYYYPNVFKRDAQIKELSVPKLLNTYEEYAKLEQELSNYEGLSRMNI